MIVLLMILCVLNLILGVFRDGPASRLSMFAAGCCFVSAVDIIRA